MPLGKASCLWKKHVILPLAQFIVYNIRPLAQFVVHYVIIPLAQFVMWYLMFIVMFSLLSFSDVEGDSDINFVLMVKKGHKPVVRETFFISKLVHVLVSLCTYVFSVHIVGWEGMKSFFFF